MTENTNQQPAAEPQAPQQPQQPAIPQAAPQPAQPAQPAQPQQPFAAQPQPQQPAPEQQAQAPYYNPANPSQPYNAGGYYGAPTNGYGQMPPQPGYYPAAPQAPSPVAALVCGIISLVAMFFLPPVGIVVGIVAIVLASKHAKTYGRTGMGKAAKICGIVGTILNVLFTLLIVLAFTALFAFMDSSAYDMDYLLSDEFYEYEMTDDFLDEDII